MKRLSLILAAIALFGIAASAQSKILVAYFSHSGNTEVVAKEIQKQTGADIYEIVPEKAYPTEYKAVVEQAKNEIDKNYRPPLKSKTINLKKYDVIILGSPCWWSTMAPPVITFLSSYNFAGKKIAPFMTHEGSRFGHTLDDIKSLCPNATILDGLTIRGSEVKDSEAQVVKWVKRLSLK
jgi:flavodoxin